VQTTAPTLEGLTTDLFGFLNWLFKSADSEVFRVASELDLSLSQLRALHILDHADHELALTELAAHVGLSIAATGRAVDVLCRHDLVTRREDAVDRRIKRLALTAAGRDKISRLKAARLDGLRQFVASLTVEERERFHRALAPVLARPEIHSFLQELPR
jgi:DNA-binding MarR family transcriptional regulator